MKIATSAALVALVLVAACGPNKEKRAAADARAAGFTPPAVTSRLDYGSAMDRRFRKLDRNADDRLTGDELPRAKARIGKFDANGDGVVTTTEWGDGVLRHFDEMDLNHDGTVTSEEQGAWRAQQAAGKAAGQAADRMPAGKPGTTTKGPGNGAVPPR